MKKVVKKVAPKKVAPKKVAVKKSAPKVSRDKKIKEFAESYKIKEHNLTDYIFGFKLAMLDVVRMAEDKNVTKAQKTTIVNVCLNLQEGLKVLRKIHKYKFGK